MTTPEPTSHPQKQTTTTTTWREFMQSQMDHAQTDGLMLETLIDRQRGSPLPDGAGT
ncbi:hypothetical protein [Roseovarius bejariae]|uniref:hypothetical protein n=1 Tax=Roseovarius bejariae TaxID=2576383 RepID=UPI0012ADA48D|nr:hypothetical protein [Roseovarius bejariae]